MKDNNKKTLLLELPMDVYQRVSEIAQEEERPVRYIIRKLVEKGLENVQE